MLCIVTIKEFEMRMDNYVVKKRNPWWSLLKAVIIIAAIAFVAYKIYDKFFKKKVQSFLQDKQKREMPHICTAPRKISNYSV